LSLQKDVSRLLAEVILLIECEGIFSKTEQDGNVVVRLLIGKELQLEILSLAVALSEKRGIVTPVESLINSRVSI
jgi:hypothetical protein